MEQFKLNVRLCREQYDCFKTNHYINLLGLISGTRISDFICFNSFGNISFEEGDEETRWHPIVKSLDQYNRNKCNALIYDIIPNNYNKHCKYNKIIIYQNLYAKADYYGIFYYNTETGKCSHHHTIDRLDDELVRHISQAFSTWEKPWLNNYFKDIA